MNSNWKPDQTRDVSLIIDEHVLQGCARGDRKAQYRLYSQCYSYMMGICIRYSHSRDDAEDLLNRSFLKILNGIGKWRKEVPFGLWIRRITINTIIDEYRKNKTRNELTQVVDFSEHQPEFEPGTVNAYLEKMEAEQVQAMVDKLPPVSRKVFNLHIVDGFSHKEIGAMLNISEGTSKWHLNNARTRLKEQVQKFLPFIKTVAS
jgi:RNA polymerase sigma factor (sigma-70 family)